jgi:hypothetical protein
VVGEGVGKWVVGNCGVKCGNLVGKDLGKLGVGLRIRVGIRGFYVNGYRGGFC